MDRLVEFHHALLLGSVTDEPAVERIVEDGLVGTPAVGIVVDMLFYLEGSALHLHLHADNNIQVIGFLRRFLVPYSVGIILRIIGILDIVTGVMSVSFHIDAMLYEVLVEFIEHIVFTLEIHHRTCLPLLVDQVKSGHMSILGNLGIISTEGRGDVHNTGTILCGHIVTGDNSEGLALHLHETILAVLTDEDLVGMRLGISIDEVGLILPYFLAGLHPFHQLAIVHSDELTSLHAVNDSPRADLLLLVKGGQVTLFALLICFEVSTQTSLCHNERHRLTIVGVVSLHSYIVDVGAHTQCDV